MRPLKSLAICLGTCVLISAMLALPALAEGGWGDNGQKGKPDNPPHELVGPASYGQPMTLDGHPWIDPPQKGKPNTEASPTAGPLAWWMQMALDGKPWIDDPPRQNSPKE